MNYVIVGNSAASIGAIESIRKIDKKGSIAVISDEPYRVYSRPLISYILANKVAERNIYYRDESFYEDNNISKIFGIKATNISVEKRCLTLEDGKRIEFEKLLLSCGGKPFIPLIKGLERKNIFTFTKWWDINKLLELIVPKGKVGASIPLVPEGKVEAPTLPFGNRKMHIVVVGAGMIGTKAVESLVLLGQDVTIVELADTVLCRALDKDASFIVQRRMEEMGIKLILGNEVVEVASNNRGEVNKVILRDKTEVPCEIVIIAIGVVPNIDIVKDTPIKTNKGIIVNEYMETNIKGIFAAGDVAETYDFIINGKRPIPIWPLAYLQGSVAGHNMAGQNISYKGGCPMNSIEFCGVTTISIGITDAPDNNYEILKKSDLQNGLYKKIIIKDDIIKGAMFVGNIDHAGVITGLIKSGEVITDYKKYLLNDDFGFIHLPRERRKGLLDKPLV